MSDPAVPDLRWVVKKAARFACMTGSLGSGSLLARERFGAPSLRVLTYHRFAEIAHDPFAVAPAVFDEQMAWLADEGRAVSLADLGAFLRGDRALPAGAVLVTIDDGFRSTHREAVRILSDRGIPAVTFVTTTLVGNRAAAAEQPEPYMEWSELREVEAAGVVIGSHAHTHRSLGLLPIGAAREEARRSREVLAAELAGPIESFAYPFGTRADYDAATGQALREAGYAYGFTSKHGAVRAGMDPIELPRVKVEGGEGMRRFRWLCRGGMDAWQAVDGALHRLQRRRKEQSV
ncbi:MAG: polysaccharide deacetylase family protein [Myxococcales bacterium]|nr:polysaccharide deacetylase family protein [Myxococcales bacterium]